MRPETLRVLIADDEPLARALLKRYAAAEPGVEVVAEAASGDEVALALSRDRPDVALLDIIMPGADVFAVLAGVSEDVPLPAVIFTTAFDSYAVRAFELNAVDYLIKPFTCERFSEALQRARRHRRSAGDAGLRTTIRDLGRRPERLLVPDGKRMIPVAVADVVWIKAEGDYTRVHANGRSFLLARTMKELETRLDPDRFIRVHRSAIVQTSHIREVRPHGSSRFRVSLSDGTVVIVSRTRAPALRDLKL